MIIFCCAKIFLFSSFNLSNFSFLILFLSLVSSFFLSISLCLSNLIFSLSLVFLNSFTKDLIFFCDCDKIFKGDISKFSGIIFLIIDFLVFFFVFF